jgi:hypothetical protein
MRACVQVYTVYVVKVVSGVSGRYWIVERRYSDFRTLHQALRRRVSTHKSYCIRRSVAG